jgi:hypothetical protein
MMKISITNVADVDVDMTANVDSDIDVDVFNDKAIMTHLFMGRYQKWPTKIQPIFEI